MEPWQLQCAQLNSDKAALSSLLRAKEAEAVATAAELSAAAARLKSVKEDAAATMDENIRLKAEVEELRHQVQHEKQCIFSSVTRRRLHISSTSLPKKIAPFRL